MRSGRVTRRAIHPGGSSSSQPCYVSRPQRGKTVSERPGVPGRRNELSIALSAPRGSPAPRPPRDQNGLKDTLGVEGPSRQSYNRRPPSRPTGGGFTSAEVFGLSKSL